MTFIQSMISAKQNGTISVTGFVSGISGEEIIAMITQKCLKLQEIIKAIEANDNELAKKKSEAMYKNAKNMHDYRGYDYVWQIFVDASMEKEIWGVVRELTRKEKVPTVGEVKPSVFSIIIKGSRQALDLETMPWGFRQFTGSGLIINARAESVIDKPMFKDSILHRRCVIPASWFYEWNRQKEKVTFKREDSSILFMAVYLITEK